MTKRKIASVTSVVFLTIASIAFAGLANAQSYPNGTGGVGYLQVNGVAVTDVSSISVPSTLTVTLAPYPYNTATVPFVDDSSGTCYQYPTQLSTNPTLVYCPTSGNKTTSAPNGTIESIQIYNVQVTSATQIVLNNGAAASVAQISPGNQLNVFGYFDGNSTISATTIHDISKPVTYAYAYVYPQGSLAVGSGSSISTVAGENIGSASLSTIEAEIQAIANQIATIRAKIAAGAY